MHLTYVSVDLVFVIFTLAHSVLLLSFLTPLEIKKIHNKYNQ